jgi:hypothetical protein
VKFGRICQLSWMNAAMLVLFVSASMPFGAVSQIARSAAQRI